MSLTINTNILASIAQNNLAQTQAALTSSVTRLSSGLKINSAADNAAGLAIADRMTSQINGLAAARQNATSGIALVETADSALAQISTNLQRIRQLAVQASNATYSASDRQSMNAEVQQRLAEINRIAAQTQYNGLNLLDGSLGTASFQVGSNAGQTIAVNLSTSVKTSQIGQTTSIPLQLSSASGYNLSTGALSIQLDTGQTVAIGTAQQGSEAGQSADSAYAAAQAISDADISGLSVTATNSQNLSVASTIATATTFSVNGVDVYTASAGTVSIGNLIGAINAHTSDTGVTASVNSDGSLELIAGDGRNIVLSDSAGSGALTDGSGAVVGASATTLYGTITLSSSKAIHLSGSAAQNFASSSSSLSSTGVAVASANALSGTSAISVTINGTTVTTGTNWTASDLAQAINSAHISNVSATADSSGHLHLESFNNVGLTVTGITDAGLQGTGTAIYSAATSGATLAQANVLTVSAAQTTLESVDSALEQIDALEGALGAVENRFSSTIRALQSAGVDTQSAQSSIQDADYAAEASNLARAQVLQQAGLAMVAQANQLPQLVLKLLQQ
ncbi:flagellin [Pararobbsia silviterrae]|nr:flagellin [Pararobbsia silviterrae]